MFCAVSRRPITPHFCPSLSLCTLLCFVCILSLRFGICMSRPRRKILDIDYKPFHSRGERVPKVRTTISKMTDVTELVTEFQNLAINCRSDVEDFFETYDIEMLVEEEELSIYLSKIEDIKHEFCGIHA